MFLVHFPWAVVILRDFEKAILIIHVLKFIIPTIAFRPWMIHLLQGPRGCNATTVNKESHCLEHAFFKFGRAKPFNRLRLGMWSKKIHQADWLFKFDLVIVSIECPWNKNRTRIKVFWSILSLMLPYVSPKLFVYLKCFSIRFRYTGSVESMLHTKLLVQYGNQARRGGTVSNIKIRR